MVLILLLVPSRGPVEMGVVVGQDSPSVLSEGFGKLDQHAYAAGFGQGDPIHEQQIGFRFVVLFPDFVQEFFEIIGNGQWLIDGQSFLKALRRPEGPVERG